MDAAEAHKHKRSREHQSAYFSSFQQLSPHMWLLFHVDDLGDICGENKQKHLFFFFIDLENGLLQETHIFITQMHTLKTKVGFSMYFGR